VVCCRRHHTHVRRSLILSLPETSLNCNALYSKELCAAFDSQCVYSDILSGCFVLGSLFI
jgi:hypothetical protein